MDEKFQTVPSDVVEKLLAGEGQEVVELLCTYPECEYLKFFTADCGDCKVALEDQVRFREKVKDLVGASISPSGPAITKLWCRHSTSIKTIDGLEFYISHRGEVKDPGKNSSVVLKRKQINKDGG